MKKLQQTGSALIVSLIMLTSVTFLAVLSLQSSTTQIRIVSNLQIKEDVFHTSKRELSNQYSDYKDIAAKIAELSLAMEKSVAQGGSEGATEKSLDLVIASDIDTGKYSQESTLAYQKSTPVNLNYSFGKDSSVGVISSLPFELTSETENSNGRFRSFQRQGFTYYVPSAGR
ncbi:MAG: hypothetical protein QF808_01245 [Thalassolituus sp.]|jgi:Tfp pilus assembly protein PilX|uniref:pilus assembly PilX family protein n=1 Tax=Thalassolituus sp. TaxID=2030822 RepID=UPI0027D6A72F|nr:hypothetical protein [Thalassolituus sp.]MDQ4422511.1 hypothetical protein [Thalassolituus sp.]MDQ4425265.1 hypothetical protein [Thalassolituus sp.]